MATTWTKLDGRSAKAVCTTGTEAISHPVQASTTVAFSTAVAGNTVTLHGITFTALAAGSTPATPYEFAVGSGGSANTTTGDNFAAAVNATSTVHGCTATNSSGTVTVKAVEYGTGPNSWAVTKVGDPITLGAATLESGVDIVGIPLDDVAQVVVTAEAAASQTLQNGNVVLYWLNPHSMLWCKVIGGDIAVGSSTIRTICAAPTAALTGQGWLAALPSGVTISSGNATVYLSSISRASVASGVRI